MQTTPTDVSSDDLARLHLNLPDVSRMQLLMQAGFSVRATVGKPLLEFLTQELGLDPDYVQDRIQTIFLNGSAVDDMAGAWIADGDRLALSGALPGLAGATMRRGGYYSRMRESISLNAPVGTIESQPGQVEIKLFNLVAPELAGHFLARGVLVDADMVIHNLANIPPGELAACSAEYDAAPVECSPEGLSAWPMAGQRVLLTAAQVS